MDITDPYNPVVLGVAKDGIGNEVMAPVTDITISKGSGLVYATAGMSVYIIDIKDPNNPVLLNVVTQTPSEPGSTTLISLGASNALVEKDGWVYLANQNQGMRVLDLDPKELGIEPDSEYPEVRIPETDYYPALSTKVVTIYGVISGEPLGNDWGLYLNQLSEPVQIGGSVDASGNIVPLTSTTLINRFTADTSQNKGFAKLYMKWNGPMESVPDNFIISLQARKIGATSLTAATSTKPHDFLFKVRHNGNVTFDEVMNDKAVFAYDNGKKPAPASFPTFFGLGEQKSFRYVQELLNQVVPRKREDVPANYSLVNEEGRYDDAVVTAVRTFRTAFMNSNGANGMNTAGERIGNTRAVYAIGPDGAVEYQNNDNTTDTFRKLMKNYNHRGTPTASGDWLHRIIDRRTLVGGKQRIDSALGGLLADNEPDKLVNGAPGNTKNDTGLYELYKNVVEKFIEYMITEGQRYADYSVNYRARADATAGALLQLRDNTPVGNPDGQVDQDVDDLEVTRGVSYSYGDIDTPEQFAAVVNQPNIANWRNYTNGHKPGKHTYEHAYWQQGQRNPANFNPGDWPTTWPPSGTIIIAYSYDLLSPDMWGGIDCNGFVQRVVNHSDESATSSQLGVDTKVQRLQTIHDKKSRAYFSDTDRSYTINTNNVSWIRKSDIVQYMNAAEHIALVHSDRPTACVAQGSQTTCTYNIIHAYGRDSVDLGTPESPDTTFTRRVRVNSNSEPNMPNPTGFGRIKLWN